MLILALCGAWGFALRGQVRAEPPDLNDGVLALTSASAVSDSLPNAALACDPWIASPGLGFPLLHYYQPLPPLFLGVVHKLFLNRVPMILLLRATMVLLLAAFPLAVYGSARRFGMEVLPSAFAAIFALLISDGGRFGWSFESYLWGGRGMYTQLWGMFLLPLSVAWGYTYLKEGRGRFGAVGFLAATCLSHLVTGVVAVGSLAAMLPFLDRAPGCWPVRVRRLLVLFALVGLMGAWFFGPFLLDGAYMNRSIWEAAYKYDSYGHETVFGWLLTG